jgi:hypothetical protein
VGLFSSGEDDVLVLIDSALVNLGVLVLIGAMLKLPMSLIVVVLMASLVKPTCSFIVLLLIDSALVNLTWSFSVLSHSVLVLMVALLKLPLSFVVVVFIGRSRSPSPLMS